MHEVINEPIDILVSFGSGKVLPLFFRWRKRKYAVEKMNLVHTKKDGRETIYYFNVSNKTNYFKLSFSTKTLGWKIDELFYEG